MARYTVGKIDDKALASHNTTCGWRTQFFNKALFEAALTFGDFADVGSASDLANRSGQGIRCLNSKEKNIQTKSVVRYIGGTSL